VYSDRLAVAYDDEIDEMNDSVTYQASCARPG